MSRAIRLSRIHAINWYGYNDSLPVDGHLLLAGVTGSGKSVLMDLIQLVLVGSERAMFNRSATGTTSDRTLKSYCLLDTKREENGLPQYVRQSAKSYVALEFAWPKGDRVETWGLRIEYRNPSENQGHVRAFYCDGALTKADFLDSERIPLEAAAFKRFIEKERDGRVFETQEQYLRDMANERHLNFNRDVLSSLLPNAMSFTNLKSFDEFCRRFILHGDKLNVEDVVASYRNFQAYERDLRELRDQLDRLTQISDLHRQNTEATRDRIVARWLAAALAHEHATGLVAECQQRLTQLRADFAKEEARIAALDRVIPDRKNEIKQAQAAIYQMPGGADYLSIKARNQILNAEIQRLKESGNSLETALRARVKNARAWLGQVQGTRLPAPVKTDELSLAIKRLDSCELDHSEPSSLEAARLLDYRHYFDYDLLVWDTRDPEAKPVSVDRQSGKFSGGENQSPYFVAILASYLRAYRRHESRWREPSLALVPIDEAFSKLSTERIVDCMEAIKKLDLQGVLSMSAGNIPAAFTKCDQLIIVSKHEERRGSKAHIRNVPVSILRQSAEGQAWMEEYG